MNAAEHKSLSTRRDTLRRGMRNLPRESREWQRLNADLRTVLDKLGKLRGLGRHSEIVVTEHAMLRFVERVIGITPAELAERVLPARVMTGLIKSGMLDGEVELPISGADGTISHRVVIRDGTVTTVVLPEDRVMRDATRVRSGKPGLRRVANSERQTERDEGGGDGEVPNA